MWSTSIRARSFAFILYPESVPDNWIDCLTKLGVPMAISPLHDLDQSERKFEDMSEYEKNRIKNGEKIYKKPHYHVLYIAKNPVTAESVRIKVKRVLGDNSISHVEIVDNIEYYFQYLTHESADAVKKKKHKYSREDIVYLNGFDIERYITLDESEKRELVNLILALIRKFKIENIIDLSEFVEMYGDDYGLPNMSRINDVISSKTGLLRLYFDGNYQRRKRQQNSIYDEKENEL